MKSAIEKINQEIETIKDLLIAAFEGGSNYWYMIDEHNLDEFPEGVYLSTMLAYMGSRMTISDVSGGGYFEPVTITHADVQKAWHTLSTDERYRMFYGQAKRGDFDATTGDVFLQLVVFKKLIFS
jgi:hypothetical protein